MFIKKAAIGGAIAGAAIAVVMIFLDTARPFPVAMNGFIDRSIFRLCPLYVIGFTNLVKSMAAVDIVTILGNALIYGMLFAIVAVLVTLLRKVLSFSSTN